jgi:GNAT superfamily N-acetyltransferase
MKIRALRADDERSAFESGVEELDRFFRRYAGQNQFRLSVGVTYVAVEEGRITGFATVAARHVLAEALPERDRKKLPQYPLPALGLVRLAVDRTSRAKGIGKQLLGFVLGLAVKMSTEVGCAGVLVDAKPGAEAFYSRYGFEAIEALEGASSTRPTPITMWIGLSAVKKALQPVH